MRIEIIRQPLHADYADILQIYVLLQVLKHMWHEVWTIIKKTIGSIGRMKHGVFFCKKCDDYERRTIQRITEGLHQGALVKHDKGRY